MSRPVRAQHERSAALSEAWTSAKIKAMSVDDDARCAGYELLGPPRHGGSSDVYRARQLSSGDVVALKIGRGDTALRLRREFDVGREIEHPNLALAIAMGALADGTPFLVTPWVEGRSVRSWIDDGDGVTIDRFLQIAGQLVDAVAALHDAGVLHRDITPSNVLVDDQRATLIDLGLGASATSATVTAPGDLAGTPRYLAPEVIRGEDPSDASDQYALALVFYELLTGRSPFPGAGNAATALHHQLHTAATPVDEVEPSVPHSIASAIEVALAKDRRDRWPSVEAFGAALTAESAAPSRSRQSIAAAVLCAVVALGAVAYVTNDGDDGSVTSASSDSIPAAIPNPWASGGADPLACNLVGAAGFDDASIGDNYFDNTVDATADGRERVLPSGGVDGSGVLVVGDPGHYGRYGEVVAVLPGQRYEFSAAQLTVGPIAEASMRVSWLDADFALLDEVGGERMLADAEPGRSSLISAPAPSSARYATPEFFKDGSAGMLLVDELVFAEAGTDCAP